MSMRDHNHKLTICEILRCINDLLQCDVVFSDKIDLIRNLLALAEFQAKRMAGKLRDYNSEFDADWWKDKNAIFDKINRELETYKIGSKEVALEVMEKLTK